MSGRRHARHGERGQSLAEFALVLTPLLLILMGIIQMGFIFNAQVTLTNAVREAAREGSIYVYDNSQTKAVNDERRNARVLTALTSSMNMLRTAAPQFDASAGSAPSSADIASSPIVTYQRTDLSIRYERANGAAAIDSRTGERMTVTATYHQDLFIPLVSVLLPRDANNRLAQMASVTMVIN